MLLRQILVEMVKFLMSGKERLTTKTYMCVLETNEPFGGTGEMNGFKEKLQNWNKTNFFSDIYSQI